MSLTPKQKDNIAKSVIISATKSLIYKELDYENECLKKLARNIFKNIKRKQKINKITKSMVDNFYFLIGNTVYGDIKKTRFGYRVYKDSINSNCEYKDIRIAELGFAISLGYHRQVVVNNKSEDVYTKTRVSKSVHRDEDISKYTLDFYKNKSNKLNNNLKEQRKRAYIKAIKWRKLLNSFRKQFHQEKQRNQL